MSDMGPAKPFLKWAGGKRQLLSELWQRVDAASPFKRYHEPFLGGGALFFDLVRRQALGKPHAFLSDSNENLVEAYLGIKEDVANVIQRLKKHQKNHCEEYYYQLRKTQPRDIFGRAARLIYLNKTCYNGLYRENRKGEFNVPVGRYKNPLICDEDNLKAVAAVLQRAKVEHRHFTTILSVAKPGDLVYFDPPYDPVSKTASFTAYEKNGFGETEQELLADVFGILKSKKVKAILSNSSTRFIKQLYKNKAFRVETVLANRSVNSRADRRGKVTEVIVTNF